MVSKSSLVNPTLAAPQLVQLRSGWDDMLAVKKSRQSRHPFLLPHLNPSSNSTRKSAAISCSDNPSVYSLIPTPSTTCTTPEDDSAFTSSTLTYLASPVAHALGLESSVRDSPVVQAALRVASAADPTTSPAVIPAVTPPPPTISPPKPPLPRICKNATLSPFLSPPSPSVSSSAHTSPSPSSTRGSPSLHRPHLPPEQPIPEDAASTISSIWDDAGPWPLPPASPSPSSVSVSVRMSSLAATMPQSPTLSNDARALALG
ncbi:hypothetical protein B0H14DRAFT_3446160 [Mycena olivaceomarginata]|nr:hypothetical protein B0H14DRAFT_3446160 [Mycena olivaceomarginata]